MEDNFVKLRGGAGKLSVSHDSVFPGEVPYTRPLSSLASLTTLEVSSLFSYCRIQMSPMFCKIFELLLERISQGTGTHVTERLVDYSNRNLRQISFRKILKIKFFKFAKIKTKKKRCYHFFKFLNKLPSLRYLQVYNSAITDFTVIIKNSLFER